MFAIVTRVYEWELCKIDKVNNYNLLTSFIIVVKSLLGTFHSDLQNSNLLTMDHLLLKIINPQVFRVFLWHVQIRRALNSIIG